MYWTMKSDGFFISLWHYYNLVEWVSNFMSRGYRNWVGYLPTFVTKWLPPTPTLIKARKIPDFREKGGPWSIIFHAKHNIPRTLGYVGVITRRWMSRAPCQYKYGLSRHGDFHNKDKALVRQSYLFKGNFFTGKRTCIYLDRPLLSCGWIMTAKEFGIGETAVWSSQWP